MYKIIGGDHKEYGPVSFDQVATWIRDNRANAQSLIQKEDGPWVPLGTLPEFGPLLGGTGLASPPPPMVGSPVLLEGGSPRRGTGAEAVQGPAVGLLVVGIVGVISILIGVVFAIVGTSAVFPPPGMNMPPEMMRVFDMLKQGTTPAMVAIETVIKLGVVGLILFASMKLRKLESFPLVVTAAILAIVPCTSPCCCVGLPIGIWVLVVVLRPEVKSLFR